MNLHLNCDLGEGEPLEKTQALLQHLSAANIACGGHAGTPTTMRQTLRLARSLSVPVGAHPGYPDPQHFGRRPLPLHPGDLTQLLLQQIGSLQAIAEEIQHPLTHIKLHGALYHAVETSPDLAKEYLTATQTHWPSLSLIVRAGGAVSANPLAPHSQLLQEGFLDREYDHTGNLLPRTHPNALIPDFQTLLQRLQHYHAHHALLLPDGTTLPLTIHTWCLHSDTPQALEWSQHLQTHFKSASKI